MLTKFYRTIRRHIPEDTILPSQCNHLRDRTATKLAAVKALNLITYFTPISDYETLHVIEGAFIV
jgi:hypothetical protein